MSMVVKVASLLENVLGAETEELAQAHGLIQRKRKFTGQSLWRMLVGTLLKKADAKDADTVLTAAQMGVRVSATAVEKRFTQRLVVFLREALNVTLGQMFAADAVSTKLLDRLTGLFRNRRRPAIRLGAVHRDHRKVGRLTRRSFCERNWAQSGIVASQFYACQRAAL